jgi:hypothetical protein
MNERERVVDHRKLRELANTLTNDQRRLLREGLAGGSDVDPETLGASLRSIDSELMFRLLAADSPDFAESNSRVVAAAPPDAGTGDGGTPDGGVPDGGTPDGGTTKPPAPKPEPPLTRW